MTTARTIAFAATFLLGISPAYAQHGGGGHTGGGHSGGHFGGHSGGSRGGLRAPGAPVGMHLASSARVTPTAIVRPSEPHAANTFTRMIFVPPPRTGSSVHSSIAPRVSLRAPLNSTPATPSSGTFIRPARHTAVVVTFGHPGILRGSTVVVFFGQPFFCPVFFNPFADPFFVDQFLIDQFALNPFCPFCATGRVPFFTEGLFFSPFARRRFFSPFFPHGRFFFGSGFVSFDGTFDGTAGTFLDNEVVAMPEENLGEGASEFLPPPGEASEAQTLAEKAALPVTLLVLRDGSMYAVTDYWLASGNLHYLTNYSGENSVPLDRIDLDTTMHMNWERGNPFTLRPKPAPE